MTCKVAVLMGGWSGEREVSIETGKAIKGALEELGHRVVVVDPAEDLPATLIREKPDLAFIALHGRGGEDGTVQGMLEMMRIPYTGSGVMASAITIDKVITKKLLRFHGVPVVDDVIFERGELPDNIEARVEEELKYPVMVKPSREGSSIAVTMVAEPGDLSEAVEKVFELDNRALVERYVHGRLLTVGLLGSEPLVLPVLEIKTREGFYDYRAKYESDFTEYEVPAKLDAETTKKAQEISLDTFKYLECEDISRVDLMMDGESGELLVLEINTMPGMTATSLIPKAAAAMGISFSEVVNTVLEGARLKIEF